MKMSLYICSNKHITSMKNKLKLIGFVACLISGFCFWSNPKSDLPLLSLENIEALAQYEQTGSIYCYGDGSVDCGDGDWVEMKITL